MAGISALGLGSGLDLSGILDSLRNVDEAPIRLLRTRQQQYDQRVFELDALNTKFLAVKTAAEELASLDTFSVLASTSSNENYLTVSTTSSAMAGTYSMNVGRLATQDSWVSTGVATAETVVSAAGGVFSYDYNGAAGGSVTMAAGTTLQGLADAINADAANPGVTAMVMDKGDGTGSSFVLQLISNDTGEAHSITAVNTAALDTVTFAETDAGANRDALLTVGGVDFNRSSNTITDLFAGMTLNLKDVGTSTVKVESDTEAIKEKILGLVNAYNSAMVEISSNSKYDPETKVSGPL
ncbi:MAG: flagellar filament capping protein FliD, partial [Desulfobulbaceae bacterium]|nr:flagellar filament capping protein FliD [Desulfobulbaceae bacterium]